VLPQDDREQVLAECSASIEVFGKVFMPKIFFANTPDFHRTIYRDLENNDLQRVGIIAPRGHSKSTVSSVLFPLWRTLFNPRGEDLLIIIISESQSQSISFLNIIKHNLEFNERVLHYFGSLVGSKWSEDEIQTSNGVRILAKGTGQRIRGSMSGRESVTRPNIIILDDFESETNSATPAAIDKNKQWLTRAVEPSLADDGRLIAIGTIISERAYLSAIRRDDAWKTHFFQAIMDGKSLWPERFPMKRLMAIKSSYEARDEGAAFWQEYMNTPIDIETQTFKEAFFRRMDGEFVVIDGIQPCIKRGNVYVPIRVTVGVDLAISESHYADYTTIVPLGMDAKKNRYVLPYVRMKEKDILKIVDSMFNTCKKYQAAQINIETVQFQQAVANEFRKQMIDRNEFYGVVETKPRTAKDARIRSLQPIYAAGRMYHSVGCDELESELLSFPRGAHDDLLDSLFNAEAIASPPDIEAFEGEGALPEREFFEDESWLTL
jgi:predicted phage terminase large subunit-like protein